MAVVGIVAEYNPFHNGHFYQIKKIREIIPDSTIICIMSGSLVQRGELSLLSKYDRAKTAVICGADVVFELPSVFSSASANIFASSAVYILDRLGGVDYLCFGSECGELARLEKAAARLNSEEFNLKLKSNIKANANFSFPRNTALTYIEMFGDKDHDIFSGSNNILAIEYIKALQNLHSEIKPFTIKRIGGEYNSQEVDNTASSASFIRSFIFNNISRDNFGKLPELQNYMPVNAYDILSECIQKGRYANIKNIETAIISHINRLTEREIQLCAEIFVGDEYKIKKIAGNVFSYENFAEKLKSRHYTQSGVRRMILNAFFGITKEMHKCKPNFTTLLAFNALKGQRYLNSIKNTSQIKIITKPASVKSSDNDIYNTFEKNLFIDNTYTLAFYDNSKDINAIKQKPYKYNNVT